MRKIDKIFLGLILCAVAATGTIFAQENKNIRITDAIVQPVPDFLKVTAVYMTLVNHEAHDEVLDSVATPVAGSVEFHQMSEFQGLMKMTIVKQLVVPAHGQLSLTPGGSHLMLVNLNKDLHASDSVALTLYFQDGTTKMVNAQVKGKEQAGFSVMPGMKM